MSMTEYVVCCAMVDGDDDNYDDVDYGKNNNNDLHEIGILVPIKIGFLYDIEFSYMYLNSAYVALVQCVQIGCIGKPDIFL